MFKRNFLEILRWGLRFHGIGHLVEVVSAVSEGAYITATLALIFISIDSIFIRSYLLKITISFFFKILLSYLDNSFLIFK